MSKVAHYQFRDERQDEVLRDPFHYQGRLRAASAMTCVEMTLMLQASLRRIRAPFLCLMAEEDCVVDNAGIDELMRTSSCTDKTLNEYDALHGMLCEVEPLRSQIENDIVPWMLRRIDRMFSHLLLYACCGLPFH